MPAHMAQRADHTETQRLRLSRGRGVAFVLVLLAGIGFSLYLATLVRNLQQKEFDSSFQVRAQQTNSNIRETIGHSFEVLNSIADICAINTQLTREQFDQIARRSFGRLAYIESLRWLPMVNGADRPAFEERMRQILGPDFRLIEYDRNGRLDAAPRGAMYFPIVFCYPGSSSESAAGGGQSVPPLVGYNVYSNAQWRTAMDRARATAGPTVNAWVKTTDAEGQREISYLIFVPIFNETTGANRRLIGYIQAVVSVTKLIESFVSRSDMAGMAIEVRSESQPIYRARDGQRVAIAHANWYSRPALYGTPLDLGEVHWRVNFWPTQGNISLADWWRMWSLPGLVLVISLLTAYYFIDSSLHSWRMEAMVVSRTHELSDTNRKLSREVSVRQRTELALRDNEARLEGILTSMADSWVIVYDSELRCESMWIPLELQQRYDLRPENMVGRRIQEITPGALSEERIDDLRRVIETGANSRVEFLMSLPHGEFWVESAMSPMRDSVGLTSAVICLMRDVSERKRADQALAESEGRYRSMVQSQVDMVVRIDTEGRLTFVNDAYCRKTGRSREELIGRPEAEMVLEPDRPAVEETIRRLMQPPHTRISGEQRMMSVIGVRWVHWESAAVLDEHGRLVEIQSVGRDITERRNAEQEHLLLAEAVEQAAESIFITDLEGVIQYVNPAFEHMTGISRSQVLGTPHQILRRDRMNNEFYRKLWRTLEAGKIWRGHFTNRRKDGEVFDQLATISPVHDSAGQITHFVSVELDMTNEKRLERQLRQAERLATIGQTIAGIAHRLKNISALIRGSATLLDQAVTRDDMASIKRLWPIFPRNSERLANLANDMLNFARVHDLDLRPLDLNDLLRKLVEEYTASARQHGVELRLDSLKPLPAVRCDQKKIHDCILNLVQNAVEACDPKKGCTVSVGSAVEDGQAVIRVSDDGPGIPPDVLPHIYEPFFSTKEDRGTGLGLPMTQKTIHGHGGSIKVESQPGHTQFSIYLPLSDATAPETIATADPADHFEA
ncbi:MAG: PAS domain S-box protein [Candidatus Sumerlaeia bacterium]